MKVIILMVLSLTLFHTAPSKSKVKAAVSTCYGYDPCAACSNCSACKHCGAGGSCGVCAPKTSRAMNTFSAINRPKSKTSNYTGQCKALTKKRSRCKRSGNGTGYCWQHDK